MAGRKRLYDPETLEIGAKLELLGKAKRFKDQYLYNFKSRSKHELRLLKEGRKVFVERVA